MEKAKIDRINAFAHRVKAGETLSEAETEERSALRAEYLAEFRAATRNVLDNTVIERPDGSREKLKKNEPHGQ
ncbi:MAG: DUF896 domain-containing protein [Oscillospiraceae bacterium]|jgi:uncharacterized protein YnzC (UPF0291/DUF896 family)|nr:DUF896 domain-containing protein [Oscillospiraceae bacterium]